jgi:hypothetical protein
LRARFVVTILSLALVYAFACSGACAFCKGSSAAAATESQGCGHATGGAPRGAQQRAPAKPDCLGRHHFRFEAEQSEGPLLVQLSATGYATQLFHGAVRAEVVNVRASLFPNLAPPLDVAIFPQQNNSILRI